MDLLNRYKNNPNCIPGIFCFFANNVSEYTKARNEILLKRVSAVDTIHMSGARPEKYPLQVICIPYQNKTYVYFDYELPVNPIIKIVTG